MPGVRAKVRALLGVATITAASGLTSVPGIGAYLAGRLGDATVGDLWRRMRPRGTDRVLDVLRRALQNERANQCVSSRVRDDRVRYHVGDVNDHGYEACAALLDHQRAQRAVGYGPLPPRLTQRPVASKRCGCRSLRRCTATDHCRLSDDATACVPRSPNARGFDGVVTHQREATADRARVRRAATLRPTAALRNDPDSARDVRMRRSRTLRYDTQGTRMWRRPGARVRHPRR